MADELKMVTVRLPRGLILKLKMQALREESSLQEIIRKAAAKYLASGGK